MTTMQSSARYDKISARQDATKDLCWSVDKTTHFCTHWPTICTMNEISIGCETCTFKVVLFFSAQSGQIMKGWKYICTAHSTMKRELWLFWERATRCYYPILRPRWVNVWLVCCKGLSSKFRGTSFYSHIQTTWRAQLFTRWGCFWLQDRRYADLTEEQLPSCESLKDTIARALPYWNDVIAPQIKQGKRVLIAAHGNSLRGIVKHLEGGWHSCSFAFSNGEKQKQFASL